MIKAGIILMVILLSFVSAGNGKNKCVVVQEEADSTEADVFCADIECVDKRGKNGGKGPKGRNKKARCDCSDGPTRDTEFKAGQFCDLLGCIAESVSESVSGSDSTFSATCIAHGPCTADGSGPSQTQDDANSYCPDNGCYLVSMHCNFGSLSFDPVTMESVFNENPLPCTPVCGATAPPLGPLFTAVAAHGDESIAIDNNNNNNNGLDDNSDIMQEFDSLKSSMFMNNIVLIATFTFLAFLISGSMICIYHQMTKAPSSSQRKNYDFVEKDEENEIINN